MDAADGVPTSEARSSSEYVQSLERGLAVIRAFSEETPELSLTEVAKATGMTRAAARRFLLTLQALGYVGVQGRSFRLLPRVLELGYAYLSSFSLTDIAETHIEALNQELQEACSVGVLDDDEIVYIARAATKRIMTSSLGVGVRLKALPTSMGRVLLAELSPEELDQFFLRHHASSYTSRTVTDEQELRELLAQAKRDGWALVDQEIEDGVRTISMPLHNARGQVVAAVNVAAHASRVSLADLRGRFLRRLRSCVHDIEHELTLRG